jgi:hypothetical protein
MKMDLFKEVFGIALFIAFVCLLIGGITINGIHHQISCDYDKGVIVK